MEITKNSIIGDVLDQHPETAQLFLSIGMHCLGCPASRGETIEEACMVHGADADALVKALHHFTFRKHEIVVLHVMAEEELTFGFDGHVHFENLEGPDEMMIDAKSIRASYLEQVNAFLKKIGDGVRKTGADYAPMNTKIPFDKALVEYLSRRRSGGR